MAERALGSGHGPLRPDAAPGGRSLHAAPARGPAGEGGLLRFGILGPLHIQGPKGLLQLGPARHRQLLVCLLQEPNVPVPARRLVDRLWGERSTAGSQGTLQGYVSLVRRSLGQVEEGGERRLVYAASGYRLTVRAGESDEQVFEDLAAAGEAALRAGDPGLAWERLSRSLEMWRGPALADGPDDAITLAAAARLEQRRLAVLAARADAGLDLGHHGLLAAELEAECAAYPLHEGLGSRRILALYRSGRQADALAAYRRLRQTLAEELGIEPSPQLRELERSMLAQDPGLELSSPRRSPAVRPATRTGSGAPDREPVPPVRYARFAGHEIAYQVWGAEDGPTLVGLPGFAQNIELMWEERRAARWLRGLGEFCRVVHFDKLGTGLSGRGIPTSSFPGRAREIDAVMDAVGLEHAFVGGFSDGGTISALYAAAHPERVDGLVMLGTTPSWVRRCDMPWLPTKEEVRELARQWSRAWGSGTFTVALLAPSMLGDADYLAWMARYERNSLPPAGVVDLWELNLQLDVRATLASIQAPTLVLHRQREAVHARSGQYLADHITGARHQTLPGADHLPWLGDSDAILAHMRAFICRRRPHRQPKRALLTVVCALAHGPGDAGISAWRQQVTAAADRFGGVVRPGGSGPTVVMATFDVPSAAVAAGAWIARGNGTHLHARVGIHTGEVEHTASGPAGPALLVAESVARSAMPAETRVSATVRDLCAGTGISFGGQTHASVPGFGDLSTYRATVEPTEPTSHGWIRG